MASEKRTSEGIALLSMYDDEDDDMEATDEVEENHSAMDVLPPSSDAAGDGEDGVGSHGFQSTPGQRDEGALPENSFSGVSFSHATSTVALSMFSPQQQHQMVQTDISFMQIQMKRRAIVDYGHEEGAMSPEAEDGELHANAQVLHGEHLQTTDGEFLENKSPGIALLPTLSAQVKSPEILDQINTESDAMNYPTNDLGSAETEAVAMFSGEEQKDVDLLEKFLPPPPKAKCSDELQKKIIKFLSLKRDGRSFNSEVRNRKEYRNPDFLLHAMTYQNIDQIGSCFSKDVFDPYGYDKSDFYDEIEADMRREMERKEHERRKSQKIDFASVGIQPGNAIPAPKVPLPTPGSGAVGASNAPPANPVITSRDGRQNKKSKWDKVDDDSNNSLTTGGPENPSIVGAHAALLSAAKAGSGYSAFAQQRRKDAEDKRSMMDRKLDRRT